MIDYTDPNTEPNTEFLQIRSHWMCLVYEKDLCSKIMEFFPLRIEVIRKPSGPDGTRGFTYKRTLRSLSDTATDLTQGNSRRTAGYNAAKEGSEFEDLVSKLCD